jgi:hypothetical protein
MAVRSISVTDTLETFRTQFNALAANDFGDIATLDPTLSATSVIGAVNELSSQVAASLGIFIEDASSTRQQIGAGQTIFMLGTSNEVEVTVSATDTMTVGLPNNVTISNNLTVTNNLTTSGTSTLGSIQISGNTITASDSSVISLGTDSLSTSGAITGGTGTFTSVVSSGVVSGTTITATGDISTSEQFVLTGAAKGIVFEGATADANELTLKALGPSADVTVSIPSLGANANLVTTGDTGTVTSTMILNGTIVNADIADSTIRAAKLNLSADTLVVDTLSANTITGTASVAQLVELNANNTANETVYITFADGATGNQGLETDTSLTYNPSTNILSTTASSAQYADLAEKYSSDKAYEPGTIVMFGGDAEVTIASERTRAVAGIVSTNPAYLMNSHMEGLTVDVALQGRVFCKVQGRINKGDMIVTGGTGGIGIADNNPQLGMVVGKALQDYNSPEIGTIEVVVGRL